MQPKPLTLLHPLTTRDRRTRARLSSQAAAKMFDDQDLGFFANFLGIFIFVLVIAYHFVMADPKYEGN
uniref:Dolichyl-diphosphooligosaccharide--protein glycosyltransferase subunit 4 n=1 Tax=Oryza meridionalis TaxID=40149 RepID=A0A0E0EEG8_9ORYZ